MQTVHDASIGDKVNRAQKRAQDAQARRRAKSIGHVTAGDARRFKANPHRSHLVRPAACVEVQDVHAAEGRVIVLPAETAWATIVHQVRPGVRFRQFTALPIGTDLDMDEAEARALWEWKVPPGSETHRAVRGAALFLHPGVSTPPTPETACLCVRLPIGPEGYDHEAAAVKALESFVAERTERAGLSRPLVVGLGEAVYGVWPFTKPAPPAAWLQIACLLEALATGFGLHLDGPVTGTPPFDIDALVPGTLQEGAK